MTGHLRAKRNLRFASVWGYGRARFSITHSLASLGFRLASPPSRDTACLVRLCPHLRVTACAFRPNGMVVRGPLVLGLTIMRLFVRVGVVERAVAVTQRQPATANATNQRTSIPFGVSSLARHRLPGPSLPTLASHSLRFSAKRNGGARVVSAGVDDNAVVRQGRGCRTAVAVTQRQPATANATNQRTSIPFGHRAIPKTLALADDIALSEPPDICRPNGISVSQVYGVTEERGFR